MTACPVRVARDPGVVEVLAWFAVTHELVTNGFGGNWRLAWLPGPGSIGDQDAWLLEGLTLARVVSQAVLADETKRQHEARVGRPAGR